MNEWMNEWTNKWMNEWMNGRIKFRLWNDINDRLFFSSWAVLLTNQLHRFSSRISILHQNQFRFLSFDKLLSMGDWNLPAQMPKSQQTQSTQTAEITEKLLQEQISVCSSPRSLLNTSGPFRLAVLLSNKKDILIYQKTNKRRKRQILRKNWM